MHRELSRLTRNTHYADPGRAEQPDRGPGKRRRRAKLKTRQGDILRWVQEGRTDAWIAAELGSTRGSVQSFRSRRRILRGRPSAPVVVGATQKERVALFEQIIAHPGATLPEQREIWRKSRGEEFPLPALAEAVRALGFGQDPGSGRWRPMPYGRAEASLFVPLSEAASPFAPPEAPAFGDPPLRDPRVVALLAVGRANDYLRRGLEAGLEPRVDVIDGTELMLVLSGATGRMETFLRASVEAKSPPDVVLARPEGVVYLTERFEEDVFIDSEEFASS